MSSTQRERILHSALVAILAEIPKDPDPLCDCPWCEISGVITPIIEEALLLCEGDHETVL